MKRYALFVVAGFLLTAAGPASALTAADCAKIDDTTKKTECLRSLPAGQSGTERATPANPSGSGPASPASPAVPGGGKGKGR